MKAFYLTTAIDYANGAPHLGHAYEKVLSDVIARWRRLRGERVFFLTGLDEHGQKVQQSANKEGVEAQAFCDRVAEQFRSLCSKLLITNDDYIRTTEARHQEVVTGILQTLFDRGEIYKAEYKGFYSTRAEQFLQEKDKVDGRWPEIFGDVTEVTESNYFFRLSRYQSWLAQYVESHPDFIFPKYRAKQVLEFLKDPINDLCISRPKERLSWGIELPFDKNYVTYVWFDALINYISAVGYGTERFADYWPADFHVIGKDILVPAHSVYWPIMLQAIGVPMPKTLLVHGWWLMSGEKMSKSTGLTVDPLEVVEQAGPDAFRYFLMREMNVGQDSDFSREIFLQRYNNELGNDLGNLVSRLQNMVTRYCDGRLPASTLEDAPEGELKALWKTLCPAILSDFDNLQFHTGLEKCFQFIRAINRYVEVRAPWKLAKSEDTGDRQRLEASMAVISEGLRLVSTLLTPVMPNISSTTLQLLGALTPTDLSGLTWGSSLAGKTVGEKVILFPRMDA
ncbi:MAG: methionine--tRNA ligase [Verrucomicrobia bacterium GWF2_51_19]|nr:MAG: methionine--tRNA ligase [Verrucomicrobia bacterium GWF2_51_19]HCJ12033.1 methionine--tRNA ligase [Opitutae bacterium]